MLSGRGTVCSIVGLGLVAGQSGCVEGFDSPSLLGPSFRVLAIRAEPLAVRPGGTTQLRVLQYTPDGTSLPQEVWLVCLPVPGEGPQACLAGAFGALSAGCGSACSEDPSPDACMEDCLASRLGSTSCGAGDRVCVAGLGEFVSYSLPDSVSIGGDFFFVYLFASVHPDGLLGCFSQWSEAIGEGSFPAPDEQCTVSFKRVRLLEEGEPPANPAVRLVEVAGEPARGVVRLDGAPESPDDWEVTLRAVASETGDGIYLSWYSDCGPLEHARTFGPEGANVLTVEQTSPCWLYVVVRTEDWGVGWEVVRLEF